MRSVILWMQVSLDGYAEGPHGAFDWPMVDEELNGFFVQELRQAGMFLYGRKVYEMMASFWPTADEQSWATEPQAAYARLWRPMPKIVFSNTLERAEWNARVVGTDLEQQIAALKEQPGGDLVLFGGPQIAATFQRLGLIDEYRIFVHPVILGAGTPLIPELPSRTALRLVEVRSFGSPVVHLRYQVVR